MNSKSKIWQIVLLALLVLAIVAILLFNNKLNASRESLSTTLAQLSEEQENAAALQADLDAAKAEYEGVSAQLEEAQASAEALSEEVETGKATAEQLQSDLSAANDRVNELESAVTEKDQAIEALETAASESEAKLAALESAAGETEAKLAALESAAGETEAKLADLESAVAEKDQIIEELNAAAAGAAAPGDGAQPAATDDETEAASDALAETLAGVEDALVKVAGLQVAEGEATEAAVAVDLDAVRADIAAIVVDETKTAEEQVEALKEIEQQLTQALPEDAAIYGDSLEAVQARLGAAESEVQQLSAELVEKLSDIDSLNAQIAALDAQAETDAAQLADLQAQLTEAEADAQAGSEALATAKAEYEKSLAELEAYRVKRDPASGEAHIATAVDNAIEVAEDGVTANWQYANSALSGNAATLSLVLDGETIYTSGALKPGEVIESVTLDKPLAPGAYQAIAVTTVYDDNGEVQLTSRVPVTLNVAG